MAVKNPDVRIPMFPRSQETVPRNRSLGSVVVILVLLGALVSLTSCSSSLGSGGRGSKYRYEFKMVAPAHNNDMLYQDDSLIIQFRFDESTIKFQLQNLSESDLSIEWEKSSIGVENLFYPVRHSSDFYGDTALRRVSVVLPPMGYIREIMIPRENVYFEGEKWVEVDLLPTADQNSNALKESILRSVGYPVSAVLSIKFGQTTKKYRFDFAVASVNLLAWSSYMPAKRIPSPPPQPQQAVKPDHLTTGIVVSGIVGLSVYLLSQKKDPAVE
ncbi:MAG: hypothetical protein HW374_1343 [Bacteroidetes bacterium]|nr:hypothetical protein [Bacteroidota bacterium]